MMTDYRDGESVRAFTLIELLTVIAIIAILAAILIPTVSVAMRKAKVSAAEQDLKNLYTALCDYAVDTGTFPPRHGPPVGNINPDPCDQVFWTPYFAWLPMIGKDVQGKFYDRFSESEDLNRNDVPRQRFRSEGEKLAENVPRPEVEKDDEDRDGILREVLFCVNDEVDPGQVPYQYFPVNSGNLAKFKQFLYRNNDLTASYPYTDDYLARYAQLAFPEQPYDRFVLFSLGPEGTDHWIIPRDEAGQPNALRLRAYYRATLDLNGNGIYDFDYRARSKREETDLLPDGTRGYGVIIKSGP